MSYPRVTITMARARTLALALLATDAAAGSPQQTPDLSVDRTRIAQEPALPNGVSRSDWSSIRNSISTHRHAFEATHNGFRTSNPRFHWEAKFDGTSALIEPATGDWSFGFALKGFGFRGGLQNVESPTFGTCAEGQTITYGWSALLSEWWINDGRGFEHGFTVHERPARLAADDDSPLVFELSALGNLQPRVNATRTGLSLHGKSGSTMLRYDGLVAFDANGALLSAWLEVDGRSVRVCVDEALAEYPIVVDPVLQEAYIKASNTDENDRFGFSVAASGDTVVVGAHLEDSSSTGINGDQSSNDAANAGAAYVFVRSGSSWTQQAYLKASNADSSDGFGLSVAISGDTVVVGAGREDSSATGINGNQSNNGTRDSGAAYVFARSGSTWTQEAYLKASNTGQDDSFGTTVAISDDTVVVGASREDSSTTGINGDQSSNAAQSSGAAYVFVRSGSTWTQEAYLKASNAEELDRFGLSVAVSDDIAVVGTTGEDSSATGINGDQSDNAAANCGAAYVFVRSGSTWTQEAYLKASNAERLDGFGSSVAVSGDTVVVGAYLENSSATGIDGDQLNNATNASGAAYVFVRSGSTWTQTTYLKASNTDPGDQFGGSVAVSGDTIVVGAWQEDSSAAGTNGDQSNNLAQYSGAAYVFVRFGSTWTQAAYLKASSSESGDYFGYSVAASGEIVVVGAFGEDSSATGLDGDQSNDAAESSGAAYLFSGAGATGTPFCMAVATSTGATGELGGSGCASVADNDLNLVATGLPALAFGFFITSTTQGLAMNPGGSEGNLCLGGSIGRYVGPGQIQQADANGHFSLLLDLTNTPQPSGAVSINAGETWNFQAWYRDTNAMGATSNLTNGLEVLFTM